MFGTSFPYGTLIVNVSGGLLMGVLAELLVGRVDGDEGMRLFLTVGVLGGFTTFSAFSLDAAVMGAYAERPSTANPTDWLVDRARCWRGHGREIRGQHGTLVPHTGLRVNRLTSQRRSAPQGTREPALS